MKCSLAGGAPGACSSSNGRPRRGLKVQPMLCAVAGALALGLLSACGPAPSQPAAGAAVVRPTPDPNRPTPTPIALPTPTPAEAPKLRARGVITSITDNSLTFRDIDGQELSLKASPELRVPWQQLRDAYQKRERITVVYQRAPDGLVLVDVF